MRLGVSIGNALYFCQTAADLCDACSSDEECSSVGATCVNGSCECASDQYTDECGICYLSKITLLSF